jgi:hypothetical protein
MTVVTKVTSSRPERKHADLFSRHGIANVTVDHIADVAGIGKGTHSVGARRYFTHLAVGLMMLPLEIIQA